MPDRPAVRYVVAPDYQRFCAWCRDERVSPRDPAVRYVHGTWYSMGVHLRPGVDEIVDLGGDYNVVLHLRTRYRA